jgi:glyoxylase-like metal-dependent hydrolase (beta-lactamase superfamily II)
MVVSGLVDGQMRLWTNAIYPRVSASDWSRHQALLADDGVVRMPFGGSLVRGIGERTVLIDAGAGPRLDLPSALGQVVTCGLLPGQLASLGVAPADVTDVVFSHLHHDHVGWASVDGADYRSAEMLDVWRLPNGQIAFRPSAIALRGLDSSA